jgi:glycosyltransferase involved in cell wall biosynthesis
VGLDRKLGGIESLLLDICKNFDREIVDFSFLSYSKQYPLKEEFDAQNVKVIMIPSLRNPVSYLKFWHNIVKHGNYKVIHFHKNSAANVLSILIAKIMGTKMIYIHSHNTSPQKGKAIAFLLHYINRPIINIIASEKIACSIESGEWLFGKKAMKHKNVIIINNGIDTIKYTINEHDRETTRKELGFKNTNFVIGHVGRFSSQKNHLLLIDIFAKCLEINPDYRLLLVGEGDLKEKIEDKVRHENLENEIVMTGYRKDTDKLYQAMDVFLFPSLYEGNSIALLEALSSGLPCILSQKIPVPKKLLHIDNIISVDLTADISEWAEAVIQMTELFFMKKRIPSQIFSINEVCAELLKLYIR